MPYLSNIAEIASGEDHSLAVGTDGTVYGFGTGSSGQLGNGKANTSVNPVVVRIAENELLENAVNISTDTKTSMALTLERKSILMGR